MQDVVGFSSDEAADRVFLLTAIYAATLVLTTVVFGIWSDRSGPAQGVRDLVGRRRRRRRRWCSAPARAGARPSRAPP